MKINDSIKKPVGLNTDKTDAKASKSAEVVKSSSASTESVTLSSMSSQMKALESSVAAGDVYDANKVEAIKNAIRDGQFKVDSEKVAEGLISTVKDLLNNK